MSNINQFNLTQTMKKEGLVLTIHWAGGLSSVITGKSDYPRLNGKDSYFVQKVQKSVQSIHNFSKVVIENWLTNPSSGFFKQGEWTKKSESERIRLHIVDYIHDQSLKGQILNYSLA